LSGQPSDERQGSGRDPARTRACRARSHRFATPPSAVSRRAPVPGELQAFHGSRQGTSYLYRIAGAGGSREWKIAAARCHRLGAGAEFAHHHGRGSIASLAQCRTVCEAPDLGIGIHRRTAPGPCHRDVRTGAGERGPGGRAGDKASAVAAYCTRIGDERPPATAASVMHLMTPIAGGTGLASTATGRVRRRLIRRAGRFADRLNRRRSGRRSGRVRGD